MEIFDFITVDYLDDFVSLMKEYLPDSNQETVLNMFKKYPKAYVGFFEDDILLGIAFGWARKEFVPGDVTFILDGIAVRQDYSKNGIGSKLLKMFEDGAAFYGYDIVSVGSADGYVEYFYIKNGYVPVEYKSFSNE